MHNYWEIYEDDDEKDGFYYASHTTRRPSFEVATVGEAVASPTVATSKPVSYTHLTLPTNREV